MVKFSLKLYNNDHQAKLNIVKNVYKKELENPKHRVTVFETQENNNVQNDNQTTQSQQNAANTTANTNSTSGIDVEESEDEDVNVNKNTNATNTNSDSDTNMNDDTKEKELSSQNKNHNKTLPTKINNDTCINMKKVNHYLLGYLTYKSILIKTMIEQKQYKIELLNEKNVVCSNEIKETISEIKIFEDKNLYKQLENTGEKITQLTKDMHQKGLKSLIIEYELYKGYTLKISQYPGTGSHQ